MSRAMRAGLSNRQSSRTGHGSMDNTLDCFIPIRKPNEFSSKFMREKYSAALKELLSIERLYYLGDAYSVSLTLSEPSSEDLDSWKDTSREKPNRINWLCISLDLEKNADGFSDDVRALLTSGEIEHTDELLEGLAQYFAWDVLRRGPLTLLTSCNLAYPGVITTGKWIVAGEVSSNFNNYLGLVSGHREHLNLPNFPTLALEQCYDWVRNIGCVAERSPGTKVANAFNAFTNFFYSGGDHNYEADIIWAMMGIEALLVSSNNIQRDIRNRLSFLLDEKVSDKQVNELYDARSRYIHGQIPIHNKWSHSGPKVKVRKKKVWLDNYTGTAVFWLVSLLQELCRRDLADIEFIENTEMKEIKCEPRLESGPD